MLRPGHNCWRIERASRLAFLVDGEEYFRAVRVALARARASFFILGWDIDTRMQLVPGGAGDGLPDALGDFLHALVARSSAVRGYVLSWDYAFLYAFEREWQPRFGSSWKRHRRLSVHYDDCHPFGGSQHQKVIVVDDDVAFVSGFDLATARWDTADHACSHPLRVDLDGEPSAPFHDVGALVSGPCASALGDLCAERWRRATGRVIRRSPAARAGRSDAWPEHCAPVLHDVDVGISRTEPAWDGRPAVEEVRQLNLDLIAAADQRIFVENQYFTSSVIADAFAHRLGVPEGPEIAVIVPSVQSGWLESSTMGVLRTRIHAQLRAADLHARYGMYCPVRRCPDEPSPCINVHSKVMAVDDRFLVIGSANLSNRSLSLDSECNLALDGHTRPDVRQAIEDFRDRLLGEHLGVDPKDVGAAIHARGSIRGAIAALVDESRGRLLESLEPTLEPAVDAITPDHHLLDPERPLDPEVIIADLVPKRSSRARVAGRLAGVAAVALVMAALAYLSRHPSLATFLEVETLLAHLANLRSLPWVPLAIPLVFVVAGLALVPVVLLIALTTALFGPVAGGGLAFAGAMTSAAAGYALGRGLGRDFVRRFAGRRVNEISRRLGRRGVLSMLLVRLLPVAPFMVVNLAAGASQVGWRDYLLGTALGLLPGLLFISAFVDRALAAIHAPGLVTWTAFALVVVAVLFAIFAMRRRLRAATMVHAQRKPGAPAAVVRHAG